MKGRKGTEKRERGEERKGEKKGKLRTHKFSQVVSHVE